MPRLEFVLVGELERDQTLARRITSWFDDADFAVSLKSETRLDRAAVLAPPFDRTLRVWVLVDGREVRAYFCLAQANQQYRYLLRRLPVTEPLDELSEEQLAEALHLSALALLSGELESPRGELERSLPAPGETKHASDSGAREEQRIDQELSRPRLPAITRPPLFEIAVGYGVSSHSTEGIWQGPRLALALWPSSVVSLVVLAQASLAQERRFALMRLQTAALAGSAALRWHTRLGTFATLEADVGAGAEFVNFRPTHASAGVELTHGATEARPHAYVGAGYTRRFGPMRAAALIELTISLAKTRYTIEEQGTTRVLAAPSPVSPRAALELRY